MSLASLLKLDKYLEKFIASIASSDMPLFFPAIFILFFIPAEISLIASFISSNEPVNI